MRCPEKICCFRRNFSRNRSIYDNYWPKSEHSEARPPHGTNSVCPRWIVTRVPSNQSPTRRRRNPGTGSPSAVRPESRLAKREHQRHHCRSRTNGPAPTKGFLSDRLSDTALLIDRPVTDHLLSLPRSISRPTGGSFCRDHGYIRAVLNACQQGRKRLALFPSTYPANEAGACLEFSLSWVPVGACQRHLGHRGSFHG